MKKRDTSSCSGNTIKISLPSPSDQETDQKDAKLGREADWRDGRTIRWKPIKELPPDNPEHD